MGQVADCSTARTSSTLARLPLDAVNTVANAVKGAKVLRRHRVSMAISTGASPVVSYLVHTAACGAQVRALDRNALVEARSSGVQRVDPPPFVLRRPEATTAAVERRGRVRSDHA